MENAGSPGTWNFHKNILTTGKAGKSLHIAESDGDGLCNVLSIDRYTGNMDM